MSSQESTSLEHVLRDSDAVNEYQRNMRFFASLLTELNVNLYAVERIFEFPIKLFLGEVPENTIFLSQVVDNFLDASVLLITKLIADQGQDIHSLRAFKNWVVQATKPAYKEDLASRLRDARLRRTDDELLQRLNSVRNRRIAHILHDFFQEVFDARVSQGRVDFQELKALRDELNALFNALAFDTEYILLPVGYDPGHSDIERLLDAVAETSDILNLPERNAELWQMVRSRLTQQDLETLNIYRRKFDFPEV